MSEDKRRYVLWGFGLCTLLTVFACVMMWVGLKPISIGQVMTTVCLVIGAIVLGTVYIRTGKKQR